MRLDTEAGLNFLLPAGLSALYAGPAQPWEAIEQRVAVAIDVQHIASEIERYIPNYQELLKVCTRWRETTFSEILAQAVSTGLFATKAAKTFSQLSVDLQGVSPTEPVPESARFLIRVEFAALAQSAGERGVVALRLNDEAQAFVAANRATDEALEREPLGGWSSINGPISELEAEMSGVVSSWGPIAEQLSSASEGKLEITTAGLLSSNLAQATASYEKLAGEAEEFVEGHKQ